jgi:hypothetical protein
MYAHEKLQNSVMDASLGQLSVSASPRRLGFLGRYSSRANDNQSAPPKNDSMTFLYELRCDLVETDLDEILPMIN